ncbi:hypothetical protein J6590_095219 [Homalodisca vitripennis]|nr:hypothetical protein J6590_095219 [Homalodisca vitripennis]
MFISDSNTRYTTAPPMTSWWRFILQIVGRIRATTSLHTSCLQQHEVHPCTPYDVIVVIYTADSRQDTGSNITTYVWSASSCLQQHALHPCTPYDVRVAIYTADSRQDTGNNITTYVVPAATCGYGQQHHYIRRACSNMRYTLAPHMTSLWRFILQIVGRIRATTPLHTSCLQQHEVHPCTPYDVIVAIYTADSRQDKVSSRSAR